MERIFGGLILEHEVALIIRVAQDLDDALDVGGFFLFPFGLNFRFELHVHGIRRAKREIAIRIVGVEIGGVEIDADPWALDRFDDVEKRGGFGDDAAVILDAEENTARAGVSATFLKRADAIFLRGFGRLAFEVAGEDADVRNAHERGVIDPFFSMSDLLVALGACRDGEGVPNAGAAEFDAAQECVPFYFQQEFRRDLFRKIIAGEFGAMAVVVRAVIDELEEIDLLIGGWSFGTIVAGVLEELAERIGRKAQPETRFAGALERFRSGCTARGRKSECSESESCGKRKGPARDLLRHKRRIRQERRGFKTFVCYA